MASVPRIVHVNDNVPGAVYIGRANGRKGLKKSRWANSHRIGDDGDRAQCIESYSYDLMFGLTADETLNQRTVDALSELRSAPALACWCRHDGEERTPENACHGDVLIELLEQYTDEQLRAMAGGGDA